MERIGNLSPRRPPAALGKRPGVARQDLRRRPAVPILSARLPSGGLGPSTEHPPAAASPARGPARKSLVTSGR